MALTVTEVPHEEQDKNWDMSDDLKSTDILTGTLRLQPPQICSFSESSVLPSAESAAVRVNLGLGFPEEPVDIYVVLDASWIALNVASADVLDGVKQDVSVYRASVEAIARIIRRTRNICDRITVLMANSLPFGEQSSMQKEQERAELATKLLAFKPGVAKTVATNVEARRFDANLGLKRLKNVLKKGVGKGPRQQPAVFMLVSDRSPNLSLDAPLPCPVHVICLPGESSGPLPAGKPETPISWVSKASGGTYSNLQSTQLPRDLIAQIISRMTKVISQSRQNSCAKPQIAFRGINGAKIMSISPLHKAPVFSPDPDQMVPHEVGDNPSDADCVESKVVPDVGIQIKEPPRRSGSSGKSAETVDETWMASFATHKLEMEATSNKMMFVVLLQIPRCDLQMSCGECPRSGANVN
ncbi:hypothetical protein BJ742DRAFT_835503 [Cladochytrium replicatum]|nr:hypothetical protein BJ742DRAFT_835503 [Cladochytrium replicatum]